jgi:DNA polymerase III delta prime subunit
MFNFKNFDTIARPKSLMDFALESQADLQTLQNITSGSYGFPSPSVSGILLHGEYGAGKSTLAKLLPSLFEPNLQPYELNGWCEDIVVASGSNGVNIFPTLQSLSHKVPFGQNFCYVIMHEVDCLTTAAMQQLKGIMDESNGRVIYIMSTNHLNNVDGGIRNRSYEIGFNFVQPAAWIPSIQRVLADYSITHYTQQQMLAIATSLNGSGRDFGKTLKTEIASYYAQNPTLLPAHLQA